MCAEGKTGEAGKHAKQVVVPVPRRRRLSPTLPAPYRITYKRCPAPWTGGQMASSSDFNIYTSTSSKQRSYFDINNYDSLKEQLDTAKRSLSDLAASLRLTNAMHATLILGTVLAAATAAIAYPRASQRPLAATDNPRETWDSEFSDTCSSEGFFRSPRSCQQFHRCARTTPGSSELVRYQFECPADQIYCPSQIACVHPWACAEPCRDPEEQTRGGNRPATTGRKSGKTCKPFVCERPGTFADPLNCAR